MYFPDGIYEVWSRTSETGSETPLRGGDWTRLFPGLQSLVSSLHRTKDGPKPVDSASAAWSNEHVYRRVVAIRIALKM